MNLAQSTGARSPRRRRRGGLIAPVVSCAADLGRRVSTPETSEQQGNSGSGTLREATTLHCCSALGMTNQHDKVGDKVDEISQWAGRTSLTTLRPAGPSTRERVGWGDVGASHGLSVSLSVTHSASSLTLHGVVTAYTATAASAWRGPERGPSVRAAGPQTAAFRDRMGNHSSDVCHFEFEPCVRAPSAHNPQSASTPSTHTNTSRQSSASKYSALPRVSGSPIMWPLPPGFFCPCRLFLATMLL